MKQATGQVIWLSMIMFSVFARNITAEVSFTKTVIDTTFRAEGVTVGDVNHDGKMDIITGDVWYEAPGWDMHEIRDVGKYNYAGGYSQCFANFVQDVNGDGWIDSIVVGFPGKPCLWYENPQNKPGHWKQRTVSKSACNETPIFVDLLGDGKPVLIFGTDGKITWYSIPKDIEAMWDAHPVASGGGPGAANFSHGLGIGDVDGDGRNDILVKEGWWKAPEDRTACPWEFQKANFGEDCADIHVMDLDQDGLNDIISSSAHKFGVWWHRQESKDNARTFTRNEICKSFSQTHAVHLVDINGDGIKDIVTGKRFYAHNGNDPDGKNPNVPIVWIEIRQPKKGTVEFIPHEVDNDSGVGTQFAVCYFNGDNKPDIVTSNKKGVRLLIQN